MRKIIHLKTGDSYVILGHISDKTHNKESITYMKSNDFIRNKIVVILIRIIWKLIPDIYSRTIDDFNQSFKF